jgi:hypothetical protein
MVAPRPNPTDWSDGINVDESQLIRRTSWVGKHHADNLRVFNATFAEN